ncbi:DnaJ domain [Phytophthora infestans]|nr:DnaJ domain [Phytophthora infestans]
MRKSEASGQRVRQVGGVTSPVASNYRTCKLQAVTGSERERSSNRIDISTTAMGKPKATNGGKLSEKDMEQHREYMKKYKMQSSDLDKHEMHYKDHYELLNISRDASHTEIRKAYRKLALKCHPDRKPSPEALAQWEGVPTAYAVLSNPNDRTEYDATLPTRDALVEFYRAYNPAKLDNATIDTIIDGWYGREVELFEMLNAKYEVAPHQGTTKAVQRAAAMSMSREKAHKISTDSQTYKSKDATNTEITWTGTIGSVFCCKGIFSRLFRTTYYEVDTTSPGFLASHGASDTPGQTMRMNLKSPATPSQLSQPVSPDFEPPGDADNSSTATTADGSPPSGDDSCARSRNDYSASPPGPRASQVNVAAAR